MERLFFFCTIPFIHSHLFANLQKIFGEVGKELTKGLKDGKTEVERERTENLQLRIFLFFFFCTIPFARSHLFLGICNVKQYGKTQTNQIKF